jgi:hypothetical protein
MALVGNYNLLNRMPLRQFVSGVSHGLPDTLTPFGANRNPHYGGFAKFAAIPLGYSHPTAWLLAKESGGLASFRQLSAALTPTNAQSALGVNVDAGLSAALTINNATLALIVALDAALSAGGTFTDAQLAIILLLQSALAASGSFTTAQLGNILGLVASLFASFGITTNVTNLVNLSSDIGGATPLSPEGLSAELLDKQDIETGYSLREALRLVLASVAGKVSGAGTATITIRSVTDGSNRITATVDSNGNRTAVTYNVGDE